MVPGDGCESKTNSHGVLGGSAQCVFVQGDYVKIDACVGLEPSLSIMHDFHFSVEVQVNLASLIHERRSDQCSVINIQKVLQNRSCIPTS
jgi:hypothetical protein